MYLHIVDDAQTINHFIRRTNELTGSTHHFLVITPSGYLSQISSVKEMSIFIPTAENIRNIAGSLTDYQAVFIHNLCYTKSRIILEAPENVVFVWGIWGYDYYNVYPELYRDIFLPYTRLVNIALGKLSLSVKYLRYQMHPLTKRFGMVSRDHIRQQAASRIDFTFNNMPHYSDVFRLLQIDESRRFHLSYYSIEYIRGNLKGSSCELGQNIYIGNSASNSSNHLDTFLQLKHHTGDRKVIVPLGYGCPRYRKLVNLAGRAIFKKHFEPVNKYISLEEYNHLVLSCNIMVFNHKRAQGLGTILFGVWAGHKIYLRKTNPVYSYLKSMGVKVYLIESGCPTGFLDPLSDEQRSSNRNIIEERYCEAQVRDDLELLLGQVGTNEEEG